MRFLTMTWSRSEYGSEILLSFKTCCSSRKGSYQNLPIHKYVFYRALLTHVKTDPTAEALYESMMDWIETYRGVQGCKNYENQFELRLTYVPATVMYSPKRMRK
jgi:hypothetical protein